MLIKPTDHGNIRRFLRVAQRVLRLVLLVLEIIERLFRLIG